MSGFYKRLREVWSNVKDVLTPSKKSSPYDELCSRFATNKPIEMNELDHIEKLCKSISEQSCQGRISDRFGVLREIMEEKAKRGHDGGMNKKRRRSVEDEEARGANKASKRHRRHDRGYQKKYDLRKENDVSWGILPKKYRTEGKTPTEILQKAISYEEKDDNLFLHLGDVSSDEEETYFSERNVRKLNEEDSLKLKPIRCNFGGEYNCRDCMEYEIRKEYEDRERKNMEREEERNRIRRRAARDRWEAKMPKSYFYLEKDMGTDRVVTRYITDDNFDVDDLEDDERERLVSIFGQSKDKKLLNSGVKKEVRFDEGRNEVSEIFVVRADETCDEKDARHVQGSVEAKKVTVLGDKNDGTNDLIPESEDVKPQMHISGPCEVGDGSEAVKHFAFDDVSSKPWNARVSEGKNNQFVFGGTGEAGRVSIEFGKPTGAVDKDSKPSPLGTRDQSSSVSNEGISSPFVTDAKVPETKLFSFGDAVSAGPNGHSQPFAFSAVPGNASDLPGFGQQPLQNPGYKPLENTSTMPGMSLFNRGLNFTQDSQNADGCPSSSNLIEKIPNQFSFLNQQMTHADNPSIFSTSTTFQASSPLSLGNQQAQEQGVVSSGHLYQNKSGNSDVASVDFLSPSIATSFGTTPSDGQPHTSTPRSFGFVEDVTGAQKAGDLQLGTGKSLFSGLFEDKDSSTQPARPSIGYVNQKEENKDVSAGMFGGSIFSVADEDPFERFRSKKR